MSGIMSDMKTVNSREFQKAFSKVVEGLRMGEMIAITKRGKPLGFFTRAPAQSPSRMPDFAANLADSPQASPAVLRMMEETIDDPLS